MPVIPMGRMITVLAVSPLPQSLSPCDLGSVVGKACSKCSRFKGLRITWVRLSSKAQYAKGEKRRGMLLWDVNRDHLLYLELRPFPAYSTLNAHAVVTVRWGAMCLVPYIHSKLPMSLEAAWVRSDCALMGATGIETSGTCGRRNA